MPRGAGARAQGDHRASVPGWGRDEHCVANPPDNSDTALDHYLEKLGLKFNL